MITIELETDMWFEISDTLRRVIENMEYEIGGSYYEPNPDKERKYQYLKTILDCLDKQLTE